MKNTYGNNVTLTLFGESHGPAIGAVVDGMPAGINVDAEYIAAKCALRRASGDISTKRRETDEVRIVSGVFKGKTTGTPICMLIDNLDTRSCDYADISSLARPGHADYAAERRYGGNQDPRGGGHFSGRITAALVAAGALAQCELERRSITIGTHIAALADVKDSAFDPLRLAEQTRALAAREFAVLDASAGDMMKKRILEAASEGDSVGGILETAIVGVPAGIGEPWFDTVEGLIAHAVFSVPAVKGIEFGAGFAIADMRGSEANDPFRAEGGKIVTETNNNGGINGGITNGMPIVFRTAIKPTPSIALAQKTVDVRKNVNAEIEIKGRHDPAIVHRARAVVDAVAAFVVFDMLVGAEGTRV